MDASRVRRGASVGRVQVVKGWCEAGGKSHERVYGVAWVRDRTAGLDGRVGAIGNAVNLETGKYTNAIGAAELAQVWSDPDFDETTPAFYSVRVLQIPTPRHSLLDAIALQPEPSAAQPPSLPERVYLSPIWYQP